MRPSKLILVGMTTVAKKVSMFGSFSGLLVAQRLAFYFLSSTPQVFSSLPHFLNPPHPFRLFWLVRVFLFYMSRITFWKSGVAWRHFWGNGSVCMCIGGFRWGLGGAVGNLIVKSFRAILSQVLQMICSCPLEWRFSAALWCAATYSFSCHAALSKTTGYAYKTRKFRRVPIKPVSRPVFKRSTLSCYGQSLRSQGSQWCAARPKEAAFAEHCRFATPKCMNMCMGGQIVPSLIRMPQPSIRMPKVIVV
jgi:hypothetical protein